MGARQALDDEVTERSYGPMRSTELAFEDSEVCEAVRPVAPVQDGFGNPQATRSR